MPGTLTEEQVKQQEERAERVKALRDQLRDGRNASANRASEDPGIDSGSTLSDDGNSSKQAGPSFETARREINESGNGNAARNRTVGSNAPGTGHSKRGFQKQSERSGRNTGKPDTNSSSTASHGTSSEGSSRQQSERVIGNIETDEPVRPRRPEPNAPLRPEPHFADEDTAEKLLKKYPSAKNILKNNPNISLRNLGKQLDVSYTTAMNIKNEWIELYPPERRLEEAIKEVKPPIQFPKPSLPKAHKFTNAEVSEKQESLIAALESDFEYIDQYLQSRLKSTALRNGQTDWDDSPIWSDMEDKDIEKLASVMLKGAKKSPAMAVVVDVTIESADYITTATLLAPRVQQTFQVIKSTRGVRAKRGEKR